MNNIIYPSDFYNFTNGVNISKLEINLWINECFKNINKKIKKNPKLEETFYTISSGNTKVLIEAYKNSNNKWTTYVSVSKNYCTGTNLDMEFE